MCGLCRPMYITMLLLYITIYCCRHCSCRSWVADQFSRRHSNESRITIYRSFNGYENNQADRDVDSDLDRDVYPDCQETLLSTATAMQTLRITDTMTTTRTTTTMTMIYPPRAVSSWSPIGEAATRTLGRSP